MATVLRFIAEGTPNVTRLDLNSTSGWQLQRGFELGGVDLEEVWLTQPGVDGGTLAASRRPVMTTTIELRLSKQGSWAAMKSLMDQLAIELDRATNVLEFIPDGTSSAYLIDTYRSPVPSFYRGQPLETASKRLQDHGLVIQVRRAPTLRGAGSHI